MKESTDQGFKEVVKPSELSPREQAALMEYQLKRIEEKLKADLQLRDDYKEKRKTTQDPLVDQEIISNAENRIAALKLEFAEIHARLGHLINK